MDQPDFDPSANYTRLSLGELGRLIILRRWIFVGVLVLGSVAFVGIAIVLPNIYRAEAILAPTANERGGQLKTLANRYGGLMSLAGIDLNADEPDKVALALGILRSRKFIADFIERYQLLVPLMAASEWDENTGELEIDRSTYDLSSETWVRRVRAPRKQEPSLQEAAEHFIDEVLLVEINERTGLVTVAIEFYSPVLAKQWLDWLISDLNETVMQRDVRQAQSAIDYLNEQISKTSLAGLHEVFFTLIEDETKTIVLARVSDEYVFQTIDPAVVPEERERPNRVLIALSGFIVSILLASFLVIILGLSSNSGRSR